MKTENIFETFKNNLSKFLKSSHSSRKNCFSNRCFNAFVNEKTDEKKIAILVGQEIFNEEGEKYNLETLLNYLKITEHTIKILNEALIDIINSDNFKVLFLGISTIIKFFYDFSKMYSKLFCISTSWQEIFVTFLCLKKI